MATETPFFPPCANSVRGCKNLVPKRDVILCLICMEERIKRRGSQPENKHEEPDTLKKSRAETEKLHTELILLGEKLEKEKEQRASDNNFLCRESEKLQDTITALKEEIKTLVKISSEANKNTIQLQLDNEKLKMEIESLLRNLENVKQENELLKKEIK
jgi:chromosome segregation ATPase